MFSKFSAVGVYGRLDSTQLPNAAISSLSFPTLSFTMLETIKITLALNTSCVVQDAVDNSVKMGWEHDSRREMLYYLLNLGLCLRCKDALSAVNIVVIPVLVQFDYLRPSLRGITVRIDSFPLDSREWRKQKPKLTLEDLHVK